MNNKSRWLRVILAVLLVASLIIIAVKINDPAYTAKSEADTGEGDLIQEAVLLAGTASAVDNTEPKKEDNTLVFWYTDDALSEYINSVTLSYQSEKGIKVKPVLVSGVELLEQINHASIYEGETEDGETVTPPDVYITTHDNLMKAYYAGIASEVTDPGQLMNSINYPETALHAVTCNEKIVGYPLYYETNFFLYNKTYMANIAKQKIEDENPNIEIDEASEEASSEAESEQNVQNVSSDNEAADANNDSNDNEQAGSISDNTLSTNSAESSEGEGSSEESYTEEDEPMGDEEVVNDPEVLNRLSTMIPATIDDILTFANNYDAPEQVESVFKWDVSDIFYNYFFVGNYMDVGGENGDDNTYFNLYNQQAVDCLTVYGNLNQFFSIDSKAVDYDTILQEFIDGKTVFTVATTDALAKIKEAKNNGEFNYDYGIAVLPDLSSTLKSRGLSQTSTVVVNGYSNKRDIANDFAEYISYTKASDLYGKTGKVTCLRTVKFEDEEIENIMQEYQKSVPLPKMIEASNYWVQLEIVLTKVWNGADPDETLKALNDKIGSQIDEIEYHVPIQESIKAGAAAAE